MKIAITTAALALVASASIAQAQGDPEIISRIIDEGKNNSQVWDHLEYLSYEIGPRLTGSTRLMEANAWTRDQFASYGLSNVHLERWGTLPVRFDRGPSFAQMVEPTEHEFAFTAKSWSAGTKGPIRGVVLKAPSNMEEFEAIKDQLEGAWILSKGRQRGRRRGVVQLESIPAVPEEIGKLLLESGIAGVLVPSRNELVITRSEGRWSNILEMDYDNLPVGVTLQMRRSDYDAMNSRIADGETVEVEADLQHHFVQGPFPIFNTIAEIPGTEFPDEVIIISGHLDSWDGPGSLGSQDNGTGTSVTLEAARILMAAGVKPRRTIRFILWTGEEQGLLGSRAYVESLSDEEKAKISAVLVDDGGTNYQGGLFCIESMASMLTEATAAVNVAFPDLPVVIHVSDKMPQGGGSDHASFNRIGIPGFFWEESGSGGREGKNYRYIHHTQHDTPRYAVPEYLVQAATCSAVTAYNLAMADTMLPRELPKDESVSAADEIAYMAGFDAIESPVSGTWEFAMTGPDSPDFTFEFEFAVNAKGEVKGHRLSGQDKSTLKSGSFDSSSNKLIVVYESNYGTMEIEVTLEEGKLKGTMSGRGGDFTTPVEGTRKVEEKKEEAASADAPAETTSDAGQK